MSSTRKTNYEKEIRILILEDLPTDVDLAKRELEKAGINFVYTVVETEDDFRRELTGFHPDIIISDYSMPTFDGMSALQIVREGSEYYPFIILTGSMNEETAVKCMKAGANDYVIKEQIKRLPYAVLEAIEANEARIERLMVEKKLLESEEKFRNLFQDHAAIKLIIDPDNLHIVDANKAAANFYGWSIEQLKKMKISDINILAEDELIKKAGEILKKNNVYLEFRHRKADGSACDVEVYSSKVNIGGKEYFHAIYHDITEKKRILDELVEAKEKAEEADQLKTAFLANMSHEIRTPMNGILGFTDLLAKPQLSGERKAQYLGIIKKSGQRMLNTVNDIIEISRIETRQIKIKLESVDICLVVRELVCFFKTEAESKGVKIVFDEGTAPGMIVTDRSKFTSIFTNLIKNAIKFTDTGTITIGCYADNKTTVFFVKDTGIGIPKERQRAVFNRFEQADISDKQAFQGSGLGLAITRSYVEMLGGKIWLSSEVGEGTTFFFTLPSQTDDNNKTTISDQKTAEMNQTTNNKYNILIVEDDEDATLFLSIILEGVAAELYYATNGMEAVEMSRNNKNIDIILMDIKMPVMDGYVATQRIRKFNKDVLIIAQTAYAIAGDREKALNAGCNGYISKPINENDLVQLIDRLVTGSDK